MFVFPSFGLRTPRRAHAQPFFWLDRTREVDFMVHACARLELFEAKWTELPDACDTVNLAFVRNVHQEVYTTWLLGYGAITIICSRGRSIARAIAMVKAVMRSEWRRVLPALRSSASPNTSSVMSKDFSNCSVRSTTPAHVALRACKPRRTPGGICCRVEVWRHAP